jgi:hypothetical protein
MPASQTKIITKLLERRQIEADLREMLEAASDAEFRQRAQRIAAGGSQVIPAIVDNLDRADARMLTAMGVVTTFLDKGRIVEALRKAVRHGKLTDRGRIGAITILERFLGEPPDDALLDSLSDPEGTAISSLETVLNQAEGDPGVLVEYVEGLDQQEPDVVLAVVQTLRRMGGQDKGQPQQAIDLLRMMAQDVRAEIAAEAMESLGSIRLAEAARALQTLAPATAPELAPLVGRLVRKLLFSGVEVEDLPPPDPGWRALVSPVSALGQQNVWFIQPEPGAAQARFLSLMIHDRTGITRAMAYTQMPMQLLLPRRPLGHLHDVALPDGSGAVLMLEVSFDLGRRLAQEALDQNRETQIPVAGPLRLLGPWLWGTRGADSLPSWRLPEIEEGEVLAREADELLNHPALGAWTLRSEAVFRVAQEMQHHLDWKREAWVRRLAGELFQDRQVAAALGQRLKNMSGWLLLAGDERAARLARAAGAEIAKSAADQPFVLALIRRDLELALYSLENQEHLE